MTAIRIRFFMQSVAIPITNNVTKSVLLGALCRFCEPTKEIILFINSYLLHTMWACVCDLLQSIHHKWNPATAIAPRKKTNLIMIPQNSRTTHTIRHVLCDGILYILCLKLIIVLYLIDHQDFRFRWNQQITVSKLKTAKSFLIELKASYISFIKKSST